MSRVFHKQKTFYQANNILPNVTCVKILTREVWLFGETIACYFFITELQCTIQLRSRFRIAQWFTPTFLPRTLSCENYLNVCFFLSLSFFNEKRHRKPQFLAKQPPGVKKVLQFFIISRALALLIYFPLTYKKTLAFEALIVARYRGKGLELKYFEKMKDKIEKCQ